jgi:hypothetical protein
MVAQDYLIALTHIFVKIGP